MNFWRILFPTKVDRILQAHKQQDLAAAIEKNKQARLKVGSELARVLRGTADDLNALADNLGGNNDRK